MVELHSVLVGQPYRCSDFETFDLMRSLMTGKRLLVCFSNFDAKDCVRILYCSHQGPFRAFVLDLVDLETRPLLGRHCSLFEAFEPSFIQ